MEDYKTLSEAIIELHALILKFNSEKSRICSISNIEKKAYELLPEITGNREKKYRRDAKREMWIAGAKYVLDQIR